MAASYSVGSALGRCGFAVLFHKFNGSAKITTWRSFYFIRFLSEEEEDLLGQLLDGGKMKGYQDAGRNANILF